MHIRLHHGLGALALALAAPLCLADEPRLPQQAQATAQQANADAAAVRPLDRANAFTVPDRFAGAAAVAVEALDNYRGGTDKIVNDTSLSGTVTGNSAVNVNTGGNFIGGGSFANMSGIPIVVQNTGANVLIQNATVVNIDMN